MGHSWSHVRREIFERRADFPTEASEIEDFFDDLHKIERKSQTFEELRPLRRTESRPLTKKIYHWSLADRFHGSEPGDFTQRSHPISLIGATSFH